MSRWNFKPEWIPVDPDGTHWQLLSYKGRYLGCVIRVDLGRAVVFLAEKFCCRTTQEYTFIDSAASYVKTTLSCTECKLSCLPSSSN